MGSGNRAYRIELGTARGQAVGIQEHELAMIPIIAQAGKAEIATQKLAGEMQIGLQRELFGMQMVQAEEMQLFASRARQAEDERLAALREAEYERLAALPAPEAPRIGQVSPSLIVAPGSKLPAVAGSKTLVYVAIGIAAYFFLR